jgi:hypothetical protein
MLQHLNHHSTQLNPFSPLFSLKEFFVSFQKKTNLTDPVGLRPLAQQRHNPRPQQQRTNHKRKPFIIPRAMRIKQEVPRQQLHKTGINQNPR